MYASFIAHNSGSSAALYGTETVKSSIRVGTSISAARPSWWRMITRGFSKDQSGGSLSTMVILLLS
ncbi:hypothetical protein D3C75_1340780 [compost metagenome]